MLVQIIVIRKKVVTMVYVSVNLKVVLSFFLFYRIFSFLMKALYITPKTFELNYKELAELIAAYQ